MTRLLLIPHWLVVALVLSATLLCPAIGIAQPTHATAPSELPQPFALIIAVATVGLLPFAFMVLTSFVKISTVLQITRSAIGAQGIPSSTVVMALSAALTLVSMAPVGDRIFEKVSPVLQAGSGSPNSLGPQWVAELVQAGREPLREFLNRNASPSELKRFLTLAREARPEAQRAEVGERDFTVVIPAFLVSELMEAFVLGFAIFLPFLVIDLVVGNVLLALGLGTLAVSQVSLPFKLLLFVATDGWGLLAQALIADYRL